MNAVVEGTTSGHRAKASSGWRRCPPDGTNYASWKHDAGWLIETKPRFRPGIPYTLYPPASVIGCEPWTIEFPTLRAAKDAAHWTRQTLCEHMRGELSHFVRLICGHDEHRIMSRLMEMAREEDERRAREVK